MPTVSKTKSAPRPPVSSRTASARLAGDFDDVGRAERRERAASGARLPIDGDDALGAGEDGALDDVQADAARADDRDTSRPRGTRAAVSTAPTPVTTAQPSVASASKGTSPVDRDGAFLGHDRVRRRSRRC